MPKDGELDRDPARQAAAGDGSRPEHRQLPPLLLGGSNRLPQEEAWICSTSWRWAWEGAGYMVWRATLETTVGLASFAGSGATGTAKGRLTRMQVPVPVLDCTWNCPPT